MNMEFLSVYNYLLDEHLRHLKSRNHISSSDSNSAGAMHTHQPYLQPSYLQDTLHLQQQNQHYIRHHLQLLHENYPHPAFHQQHHYQYPHHNHQPQHDDHLRHLWQPWKMVVVENSVADASAKGPPYRGPAANQEHLEFQSQQRNSFATSSPNSLISSASSPKSTTTLLSSPSSSSSPPSPATSLPSSKVRGAAGTKRKDVRLTNKELPSAKWRRERRIRLSAEYQQQSPTATTNAAAAAAAATVAAAATSAAAVVRCPLGESNGNSNSIHMTLAAGASESPLDMSAKPPPPPYREPLPGSQFAHHLARPSVIVTQAPKARGDAAIPSPASTTAPVSTSVSPVAIAAVSPSSSASTTLPPAYGATASTAASTATFNESISMIDPVIDEHFRRSLGADYAVLFGNKKPGAAIKPTPITALKKQPSSSSSTGAQQPSPLSVAVAGGISVAASQHSSNSSNHQSPAIAVATVSPIIAAPVVVVSNTTSSTTSPTAPTANAPLAAIVTPTVRSSPSNSVAAAARQRVNNERQRQQQQNEQEQQQRQQQQDIESDVGMSVDDHFAKALGGDTWKQLQRAESRNEETASSAAANSAPAAAASAASGRGVVKSEPME